MKNILAAVLSIMASCALAETETIDGVSWTFRLSGGEAILGGGSKSSDMNILKLRIAELNYS